MEQQFFLVPIKNANEFQSEILTAFPDPSISSFSAGVGCVFHSLTDARQSAAEAKEALHMIHQCKKIGEIRFFEDTGIYRLLFEFNDKEELRDICSITLGDLFSYDDANQTELVQTLEVYLNNNYNVTATAEAIAVHRNTIKYRIKKIQEIQNVDFSDYNQCFHLRLAYKIRKYIRW